MTYTYAKGTTTSVDRSRAEIEKLLVRGGGAEAFMYARQGNRAVISFKMSGRIIRINLLEASHKDPECQLTPSGRRRAEREALLEAEKETRRRWRALCLVLKAKFAAVHAGILRLDEEFLPYMQLKDGRTVAEWSSEELKPALDGGRMPKQIGAA